METKRKEISTDSIGSLTLAFQLYSGNDHILQVCLPDVNQGHEACGPAAPAGRPTANPHLGDCLPYTAMAALSLTLGVQVNMRLS